VFPNRITCEIKEHANPTGVIPYHLEHLDIARLMVFKLVNDL